MKTSPVVGIDLGTTYCCIGVWHEGRVKIVPNGTERTTPSCIVFKNDNEELIGTEAKECNPDDITTKIYGIKRIIGRKFDDPVLKEELKNVTYNIIDGKNKNPLIKVNKKTYSTEEISAKLLEKNLKLAIDFCGCDITDAVITVPANFNDSQREATKNAGELIGLKRINIISEPNAAALAYGLNKKINKTVLIFDLGGGTLDVSILKIRDDFFEVLSTCGDAHFGGEDFDNLLVNFCFDKFQTINNIIIPDNKVNDVKSRMRFMCEKSKKMLTFVDETKIIIDNIYKRLDLEIKITRKELEELCKDSFLKCIPTIDKALKDSKKSKDDINEIVLIGGSSNIPKIREIVKEYFGGKELNSSINPDEAVAYGATIEAASKFNIYDKSIANLIISDITAFSLGIEVIGKDMSFIIERLSKIPTKVIKQYTNAEDNQKSVLIKVFEGEKLKIDENTLLGKFVLQGITPLPKYKNKIDVTFDLDSNGILNVTAIDQSSQKSGSLKIEIDKGRLCKTEIDSKSKEFVEKRQYFLDKAILKKNYSDLILKLGQIKNKCPEDKVDEKVEEEKKWLSNNETNLDVFKTRLKKLETLYLSLVDKKPIRPSTTLNSSRSSKKVMDTTFELD